MREMQYRQGDQRKTRATLGGMPSNGRRDALASPFKTQLLKWVGNKQKFAHEIIGYFPDHYGDFFEPFVGSGGIIASLAPDRGFGSDTFAPLVEIWQALVDRPDDLKRWYRDRWQFFTAGERVERYEAIKANYNARPNGADLVFLCRACYGGVVRFRKADGYMSTPIGVHTPISPDSFDKRADLWADRLGGTTFQRCDYRDAMAEAKPGDLIYCDPPYTFSQAILYGAQNFRLEELLSEIAVCADRGVHVALSIDGTKKSGDTYCDIPFPDGLFKREVMVNVGRSMLRRFQMGGKTLESEGVKDRLMLTY